MGIGTGIAIYFIIWWLMIFITLPFRMRSRYASRLIGTIITKFSEVETGVATDGVFHRPAAKSAR